MDARDRGAAWCPHQQHLPSGRQPRCPLVDTGIAGTPRDALQPYMEAAHQDPRRLRYAVNTHSDIDHMGGNASLRELLPEAVLICHVLDRPMVEDVERSIARRYGEFRADHGSDDPRT